MREPVFRCANDEIARGLVFKSEPSTKRSLVSVTEGTAEILAEVGATFHSGQFATEIDPSQLPNFIRIGNRLGASFGDENVVHADLSAHCMYGLVYLASVEPEFDPDFTKLKTAYANGLATQNRLIESNTRENWVKILATYSEQLGRVVKQVKRNSRLSHPTKSSIDA